MPDNYKLFFYEMLFCLLSFIACGNLYFLQSRLSRRNAKLAYVGRFQDFPVCDITEWK